MRDTDGKWELTLYGKNVFNTQQALSRGFNPLNTTVQILATGLAEPTGYRQITVTP